MSDEQLRALERAAATDTGQVLALAMALERAGRPDEAWVALCRGVDRPEVRAELVGRPAWTHPLGPGGARFLDVPPVRQPPRVRWTTTVRDGRRLLASPLGVVVLEGVSDRPTAVLDPRTGQLRWAPDPLTRDAWLDGGLLLAHRRLEELLAWRLWADDGDARPEVGRHALRAGPGRLDLNDGGRRADAHPLLAPEATGRHLEVMQPQVVGRSGLAVSRVHGARAIVARERACPLLLGQWFDPADQVETTWVRELDAPPSAAALWTRPGHLLAADDQGVLVRTDEPHGFAVRLLALDGGERWAAPAQHVAALGPRHVVLGPHLVTRRSRPFGDAAARVYDRATGHRRVDVPLQASPFQGCLVRDLLVLPGPDGTLAAWTLDGALAWRAPVGAAVRDVAPLPGALVALQDDGQVLCLDEATAP